MEVRSAALIENAERLLNQSIGKTLKAKRAPRSGEKPGTKEPTGRGKGHQRAERVQSGETFGDRSKSPPRGKIHIDFAELDSDVVGDMPGNTVRLNLNVGAVASARDEENVINVYTMAMFIYHMKTSSDGHFDAKVIDEVLSKVGRALSTDANASVDGRSVLPIAAE